MAVTATLRAYEASTTWRKPSGLLALDVLVRGAGGAGDSTTGGGGGAAVIRLRIPPDQLGTTESVIVGAPGISGGDGGYSAFGSLLNAPGGTGGVNGGVNPHISGMRGGNGGAPGNNGESVSMSVIQLLCGGGGGAGSGTKAGGMSGLVPAGADRPPLWQWCQSGAGGNSGSRGGFPSGGGGANAPGAGGCVVVIEYTTE